MPRRSSRRWAVPTMKPDKKSRPGTATEAAPSNGLAAGKLKLTLANVTDNPQQAVCGCGPSVLWRWTR